jgi:hypothetical protein
MKNGLEGIYHNSIWSDESSPETVPEPPSFESKMEAAQSSLRKKIEELIRAREKRIQKDIGKETREELGPT